MLEIIDLNFQNIKNAIGCFLIREGSTTLLIESGPHSTLSTLLEQLNSHGIEKVDQVLLTHIHLDHAGAAWALAEKGADIYLHEKGIKHLNNPEKLMASATRIYGDEMDRFWGEMHGIPEEKLIAVDHKTELSFDELKITALYTPGHAVHHLAWQMGDVIFTGDVAGVKISNGPVVPPCPPPDINLEDWLNSIDIIRKEKPSALYLTHFGPVRNVTEHLDNLETMLWDWAHWIKPRYENEENQQDVVPEFQAYVAGQLRQAGVDDSTIEIYEAANPSWMSVAGLFRYWHKKLNP